MRAYDLLLQAQSVISILDRDAQTRTDRLLRQAIALDPAYALAFAMLAQSTWNIIMSGWLSDDGPAVAETGRLARRAVELGGDDPDVLAHACGPLGLSGDLFGGIAVAEKALALNPNSIMALNVGAILYAYAGETRKAIACTERAERLNPFELLHRDFATMLAHFVAGEYEQALLFANAGRRVRPNSLPILRFRTAILGLLGRTEEARQSARELLALVPEFTVARARIFLEVTQNNIAKVPGVVDAYCAGLRLAAIPE